MKSKFLQNIRLAGFPLGLGLTSVLVSGTLNRVMIVELGFPAIDLAPANLARISLRRPSSLGLAP